VVDDHEKVIGLVSEADMLAKEALGDPGVISGLLHHREVRKAEGLTAGDLMTHPAVTVRPEESLEHAARLMYTRRVKRLPVVDADRHLAGIISRADVLSVFDRTDGAIHREILDEVLLGEFLLDPLAFDVTVKDGIVTLAGRPETSQTGHEIVRRVRHVQGVVAVRDRLSYPPARGDFDVAAAFPAD
ncbi:MAG: CBS domain-containing protein, partial [Streptosporangiaceae bacterium]